MVDGGRYLAPQDLSMDGLSSLAKGLILAGAVMIFIGGLLLLFSRFAGGRGASLPGDIVIRKDGFTFYFPIVTCIVISIVLTVVFRLISGWRK